jgi:hypothetical protein
MLVVSYNKSFIEDEKYSKELKYILSYAKRNGIEVRTDYNQYHLYFKSSWQINWYQRQGNKRFEFFEFL